MERLLAWLTPIAFTIYPNIDINVPSSCIRHATGVDSLLRSPQSVLRTRTITFFEKDIHAPNVSDWAVSSNTNPSRVSIAVQSYESPSSSTWSGVWAAVETYPSARVISTNIASISKDDAVVGKWWAAVWQFTVSHIYSSTWVHMHSKRIQSKGQEWNPANTQYNNQRLQVYLQHQKHTGVDLDSPEGLCNCNVSSLLPSMILVTLKLLVISSVYIFKQL